MKGNNAILRSMGDSPLYKAYKARVEADGGTVERTQAEMRKYYGVLNGAMWALVTSGRKAAKLYTLFQNTAIADLALSRASKTTAWSKTGKLIEVADNVPAFDWNSLTGSFEGVVLCPQGQNLVPNSVSNAYSFLSGATVENYAWEHTDIYTHAVHFGDNSVTREARKSFTQIVGVRYCYSVFIKMDDGGAPVHKQTIANDTDFVLALNNGATDAVLNPLIRVSQNVYLASISRVPTITAGTCSVFKRTEHSARGFRVVGFMVNEGSLPTRHIATRGTADVKLADAINTAQVLPMNNVVLFADFRNNALLGTGVSPRGFYLKVDASNYIVVGYTPAGVIGMAIVSGGAVVMQINSVVANGKVCARFVNEQYCLVVNGIVYNTFTTGNQFVNNPFVNSATVQLGEASRNISVRAVAVKATMTQQEMINLTL